VLARHPAVQGAVAAVRDDPPGRRTLVAYAVPAPGAAPPDAAALKDHMRAALPDYMVPAHVAVLDAFPLTANGKVDRARLPPPGSTAAADGAPRSAPAARGDAPGPAARIAALAAEVLGLPSVEPAANLFELGASSVDMVRLANRIAEAFGVQLGIEAIYGTPTPAGLAAACAGADGPAADAPHRPGGASARPAPLLDPAEREAFKAARPGRRAVAPDAPAVPLDPAAAAVDEGRAMARATHRTFAPGPVPAAALAGLLATLRERSLPTGPKYLYPSANGLYPVEVCVACAPGRVAGVAAGTYHYDPAGHRLVVLSAGAEVPAEAHDPFVNRPVFERSAFSLFLVARTSALEPLYGREGFRLAALEAGHIGQLLMTAAPQVSLGLCPIGYAEVRTLRPVLALEEDHELLYGFVGGGLPDDAGPPPDTEEGEI